MAKFLFKKGHFVSKETRLKISLSKLGKKRSDMVGENHFNYKGGMPKCLDCGKQLGSYTAIRCRVHAVIKRKDNFMFKGGKPKCINCSKIISYGKIRCKRCFGLNNRGINNTSYKGGKPNCLDCNKKLATYGSKRCKICSLREQFKNSQPTSIEKKVYDYLLLNGILFERQKLINGKFIVDAYIPSLNLVIEADGKYWHDMDRVQKKDKAENAYLTKCGFKLLRLKEKEINSGEFKERMVL